MSSNMTGWWWRVCWTLLTALAAAGAAIMGDECDWTGSGSSDGGGGEGGGEGGGDTGRGVTPVYVRCREGRLTWLYPRGALRLLFQLPSNDQDFTVCVRVLRSPRDDRPDVFAEEALDFRERRRRRRRGRRGGEQETRPGFAARLFVEGARSLLPLYAPGDGDEREVRCFPSRRGRAAVYVEALEEGGAARPVAALRYEARPLPRGHYDPAAADCRPCSDEEMSLAFCTSDLVSRGVIVGLEERSELDTTQLTLRLTKLLRHTHADADDSLATNRLEAASASASALRAHVHVGTQCGAAHGAGEFVFMARRRLGRLALTCAPRLAQWQELARNMNADGSAHCLLEH